YKVFISKSAGNPKNDFKVIGRAFVGKPFSACSDSLISIGCFESEEEAINLSKYLSSKFLRFMVQILKSSQNVTQIVYGFVPMQNFTSESDIDWTKPIPEIDKILYKKYQLEQAEIDFIEKMIKPME
ncbi:MAG: restriction endonuclease, partial [Ruminococcus sp.]|nr:restriction endonuclease [Ruminococcus sp.]